MTTLAAAGPNTFAERMQALIRRRPVAAYLVMSFTGFWLSLLPVLFINASLWSFPFSTIGAILGYALPAFLVTAITDGRAGVRDLLECSLRWRIGIRWYVPALLGIPAAMFLIATSFLGTGPLQALVDKWTLLFTVVVPQVLIGVARTHLCEELGWTGFMQHRLQNRHSALLASLMVAPAFALIHFPLPLIGGPITAETALKALVLMVPTALFAVFFRPLITWLYNGSGRSVLVVALLHAVFNTFNDTKFASEFFPGSAAPWLAPAALVVLAVLVAVLTRSRLAYQPER